MYCICEPDYIDRLGSTKSHKIPNSNEQAEQAGFSPWTSCTSACNLQVQMLLLSLRCPRRELNQVASFSQSFIFLNIIPRILTLSRQIHLVPECCSHLVVAQSSQFRIGIFSQHLPSRLSCNILAAGIAEEITSFLAQIPASESLSSMELVSLSVRS